MFDRWWCAPAHVWRQVPREKISHTCVCVCAGVDISTRVCPVRVFVSEYTRSVGQNLAEESRAGCAEVRLCIRGFKQLRINLGFVF